MILIRNNPLALLVTVAPALAAADVALALIHGLSWGAALGLFYGALAVAELIYLMIVMGDGAPVRSGESRNPASS